jgi:hypothetical protein
MSGFRREGSAYPQLSVTDAVAVVLSHCSLLEEVILPLSSSLGHSVYGLDDNHHFDDTFLSLVAREF